MDIDLEFLLDDDHKLFQKNIREFAQTELAPGYLKRAKTEGFDWELNKKIGDLGLLGFNTPEEYGGQGDALDFLAMGIAIEELGKADFNMAMSLLGAVNTTQMIVNYASKQIKDEVLPKMCRGEVKTALRLTEASGGTDLAGMKSTAVREGDYYILNGEKSSCSFVNADYHIVYAKTDPEEGNRGVSAFFVPDEDSPSMIHSVFSDIGMKPVQRGAITFKNHKVPAENLLHEEGKAFKMAVRAEDAARPLMALQCLGSAQTALDDAIAYSKQRYTFGKPIAAYQGISYPIAEAATHITACRMLCYYALWKADHDMPISKEAAMVKWWGPSLAFNTIKQCLLIHGHFGYSDEFSLAQRLVDVMGQEIGGGTEHLNKLMVAQAVIGRVVRDR